MISIHSHRRWLILVFLAIAIAVVIPQLHIFRQSLRHLHNLDYARLLLAFGAVSLTFVLGAAVYKILAFKTLVYGRTLIAQIAANFINRLLPAGIGGIGANYRYLRNQKHTASQAASVITANNGLGLVGHLSLVLVLTVAFHAHAVPIHVSGNAGLGLLVVMISLAILLVVVPKFRAKLSRGLQSFGKQLKSYRKRPVTVGVALCVQICLTLSNVTAFWLCVLAVHISLTFVGALLVFTFGFGVGSAAPTPGGLGGIEAGLVAGLVAYQIASPTAVAAVLVYRLISYWLPLAISGLFLIYASRQRYFS
jgi:uncharacterized membrane protein YbhN (UPF0104 family)